MPRNRREDGTGKIVSEEPFKEPDIWITKGVPFYFNPDIMRFIVGPADQARIIAPGDIETVFDIVRQTHDLDAKIDPQSEELLYLVPIFSLVQLESFRRKLAEISQDPQESWAIALKIEDTMAKVLKKVDPSMKLPRRRTTPGRRNFMEFAAQFNPQGEFRLQTFGNCACMGYEPETHSTILSRELEYNRKTDLRVPLGYWVHNVDSSAQMISLFAGAGALAYLVKNRPQPLSTSP